MHSNRDNVIIEVVKQAEDSQDWIVRFFACYNRRTSVRLTFAWPLEQVTICDLLENDQEVLDSVHEGETAERSVDMTIKPFEIRTIKVRFR